MSFVNFGVISTYSVDHAPFHDAVLKAASSIEAIVVVPATAVREPLPPLLFDFIDKVIPVIFFPSKPERVSVMELPFVN